MERLHFRPRRGAVRKERLLIQGASFRVLLYCVRQNETDEATIQLLSDLCE